jgi:hypothetical protein
MTPRKRTKMLMDDHGKTGGFDKNYTADEILEASEVTGELMFKMKWKEIKKLEWVPARQANMQCPQVAGPYGKGYPWTP